MKYNLPKKYLSYSALELWRKDKNAFRSKYYEGIDRGDTIYTLYGREVHEIIDKDPAYAHIRLPIAEQEMTVKVSGVTVMGYIDTFDPETHDFNEYKSGIRKPDGSPRWTKVDVQKHDQLPFYSMMIEKKYGTKVNTCKLVWLETQKEAQSMKIGGVTLGQGSKLSLTGHLEVFERKIYQYDRDRMKKWVVTSAEDISNDYTLWQQNKK